MQEAQARDNVHKTKQLVDEFFAIFEALKRVHCCQNITVEVLN